MRILFLTSCREFLTIYLLYFGEQAFAHSRFLKDVTIDDSNLTILGDEAFAQCTGLASIKFTSENSRLKTIGCQAFYNTSLDSIIFPPYVETIGAGCLYLSNIKEITDNLIKEGMAEEMPAAVISGGTTEIQEVLRSSLGNIAKEVTERNMLPPAIIVIGETAAYNYVYNKNAEEAAGAVFVYPGGFRGAQCPAVSD